MDLASLLTQQANTGLLITRFITNLKKTSSSKLTFYVYESRLKLLEKYWSKFCDRHEEALVLSDFATSDYAKKEYFSIVEEAYIEAQAFITEQMAQINSSKSAESGDALTATSVGAKLPKLNLPSFSGNYLEWVSFKDLFVSAVNNNRSLSNATRLQYLKAQLSGEAAKLVSNIPITDANFVSAWQALTERYDNERIIVNHYFDHLLSLKSLSSESASNLRQLLDTTAETRRAMENLNRPVAQWDDWFVHLTVKKLDGTTRKDWETSIGDKRDMPSWKDLSTFLTSRIHALEAVEPLDSMIRSSRNSSLNPYRRSLRSNMVKAREEISKACSLCGEPHYIGYCKNFKQKTPLQRKEEAIRLNLCSNCLKHHSSVQCPSPHRCSICKGQHHTLLHQSAIPSSSNPQVLTAHSVIHSPNFTLLATALVKVQGSNGRSAVVRTLLDQGSEATFMSENLAQLLRLPRSKVTVPISGLGASSCGTARSLVHVQLTSVLEGNHTSLKATALVLPRLLQTFRPRRVDAHRWSHLRALNFSDCQFQESLNIELVIGADLYGYTLLDGLVKGPPGTPVAQQTIFGWILSGTIHDSQNSSPQIHNMHCSVDISLSNDLRRFWEIEEIPAKKFLTSEEQFCEEHFQDTHSRDETGKFLVCLPRRSDVSLGDSYTQAYRSFHRNELQRQRNPLLNSAYQVFMEDYIRLGHMKPITKEAPPAETFYLPHHAVWKKEGENSKIRVVFNASAKSTSGNSLNDALLPGPKLQQDLSHILLRWRKYSVAFSADIVKMFRQIWVNPKDQPLQRILWRNSSCDELQEFQLQTVTYGTTCAPFLAIRCLLQLASEEASRFPEATDVIRQQMYVDDVLTGADTVEEALDLKLQLEGLLRAGGFELSKWSSNVTELAPSSSCNHFLSDGLVKTLGIHWNPAEDIFGFQVQLDNLSLITKRTILSCISRLFDPLGWLAPVLITAKVLIQDLWSVKVGWDAQLPQELEQTWKTYYLSLSQLQEVRIPRWIRIHSQSSCEIHGFCDASLRAYAAAAYIRVANSDETFHTALLAAKTKVAPLKIISLPRLELCGAVLLIRLLQNICEALQLSSPPCVHAWTDSQVVLHWINAVPARWKCFVANRVSEIHQTLPQTVWHHVNTSDNPADPASRGVPAASMKDNLLWWHGPHWLSKPSSTWPLSTIAPFSPEALEEESLRVQAFSLTTTEPWNLSERYSSLTRLIRVTSWLFRFIDNARIPKEGRNLEPLSVQELARSRWYWIKKVQEQQFAEEIGLLRSGKSVPSRSPIFRLYPLLDTKGVLRVGGRLENSSLSYDERHPVLLSSKAHFVRLLAVDCHLRTLHGGPQLTLNQLHCQYWILGGRNLVKKIIRTCNTCFRFSRKPSEAPLMGQLPTARVTPSRPFLHSGLDYAGPIKLRHSKSRGRGTSKGYIALFVCMATKAVHLEAVSECSTAAFLAAFKRFCSRRGIPATLSSDQATTFKGADAELQNLLAHSTKEHAELVDSLTKNGTQWHFIPPHSPHFGGLWESGVRSVKGHLRKIIGDTILTFEELTTVLAEIEACLNSRPLTPLSSCPQDFLPLTPGHFLTGSPLTVIPEPSLSHVHANRLTRWQLLRRLSEEFWHRWSREYVHQLQPRQKWATTTANLEPGDMVLLREDNLPPSQWHLGRILQTHPGDDGVVRVVTVRTASSTLKRPTIKVCKLPTQ